MLSVSQWGRYWHVRYDNSPFGGAGLVLASLAPAHKILVNAPQS